ncbi:hypothetical protein V9T40_012978 [Parthenolecanium corni]|uniref:Amino acid transporter transmembrane domain-containing protein n=1 Tax=Parthenolecanium corni TaxID=536013 RepID=A0AAN9XZU9_9HEMI
MNGDDHQEYADPDSTLPPESHKFLDELQNNQVEIVKNAATKDDKLTFWGTVVHLLIGGMSPTILNLPATFHQVGYVVGFVGSFLVVIFYAYCMHIIISCEKILCHRLQKVNMSYWEVLYYSLATGPPRTRWLARYAKPVTYIIFIAIWGGGNSTYILLICENIKSVLKYTCNYDVTDRFIILWLTLPLVLLCWIPNLKVMVVCSVLSNTLNAASIAVILYVVLQNFPFFDQRIPFGDVSKLPYFLSIIFITVNGTGLILSLKNQMKQPKKFSGPMGVVNLAYVPTGALYAIFGLLCYLKYGKGTEETVILNLPASTFGCVVQTMYSLAVVSFYPLVTYVTFEILWDEVPKDRFDSSPKLVFFFKYSIKTINALFSIVLAYIIPNITLFISLIGSVCVALDSIILPAIMEWLVHSRKRSLFFKVKTIVFIVLGVALMIVGFSDSYKELVEFYST